MEIEGIAGLEVRPSDSQSKSQPFAYTPKRGYMYCLTGSRYLQVSTI